jgi:hypothetical protein
MVEGRVQLWSCGGGRQSAGIAALIVQGRLPKPDHVVMTALRGEKRTTWDYVCGYIRPAMRAAGVPFTIVPSVKYATKGLFGGEDGRTPLMPVYTNQSGQPGKLSEWCSGEWKREVSLRWAAEQGDWKARGVDNWVGISWDEKDRRRNPRRQWFRPVYPLLDMMPRCFPVSACLAAVEDVGWPPPPRSRCVGCPNQSDAEWAELTPAEFEKAARTEDAIRSIDSHAYLHKSMVPLRVVTLNPAEGGDGLFGGCSAGMCY